MKKRISAVLFTVTLLAANAFAGDSPIMGISYYDQILNFLFG